MVGSNNLFLATRGSRPGDGLADILFGALFTVALRHIRRTCAAEGLAHVSAGELIGRPAEIIPVGWADDLAVLADFPDPLTLQQQAPRVADITISTLEHLRFRVNLGRGKTETMIDVRGPAAKKVRGDLLTGPSTLTLPDGRTLRISSEYRYLGVIQQPRDTGRRDQELALQRAQSAWAHARSLIGSASLPWALRHAWIAGRILPAAYATLATSTAVSGRATAPLEGFFERATRALSSSWQFGHVLSKPSLFLLACLTSPSVATIVARARLVTQLCHQAPTSVWEIFEAGWNRATTLCSLLADACQSLLPAIPSLRDHTYVTLPLLQQHHRAFRKACQHISRFGTAYRAFWDLWQDIALPRTKRVIGTPGHFSCPLCHQVHPSRHALAAHIHRKHSVVNSLTQFTAGTTCLWCQVEHHSTDRLKYHLRRSPSCVHGLRVTVGRSYIYGSGSKRRGVQQHRGLPPFSCRGLAMPHPHSAAHLWRAESLLQRSCLMSSAVQPGSKTCIHGLTLPSPVTKPARVALMSQPCHAYPHPRVLCPPRRPSQICSSGSLLMLVSRAPDSCLPRYGVDSPGKQSVGDYPVHGTDGGVYGLLPTLLLTFGVSVNERPWRLSAHPHSRALSNTASFCDSLGLTRLRFVKSACKSSAEDCSGFLGFRAPRGNSSCVVCSPRLISVQFSPVSGLFSLLPILRLQQPRPCLCCSRPAALAHFPGVQFALFSLLLSTTPGR